MACQTLSRHISFKTHLFRKNGRRMFEGRIYGGFSGQELLLVTNFHRRKMKQIFSDNRLWSHATVTPSPNMVKHGWQSKTMIPWSNCCRGNREGGFNRSRRFTMLEEMEGHCRHSRPGISLMTLLHRRYINLNFVKKKITLISYNLCQYDQEKIFKLSR